MRFVSEFLSLFPLFFFISLSLSLSLSLALSLSLSLSLFLYYCIISCMFSKVSRNLRSEVDPPQCRKLWRALQMAERNETRNRRGYGNERERRGRGGDDRDGGESNVQMVGAFHFSKDFSSTRFDSC